MSSETGRRTHLPLLALSLFALAAGLYTGLLRLGWDLPTLRIGLSGEHAPLMVSGFLGTLIGLERAVGIGRKWMFAGPLLSGTGALTLLLGLSPLGPALLTAGSVMLVAATALLLRQSPGLFSLLVMYGAWSWLVGNVLWVVQWPLWNSIIFWAGFLFLTIAGERLELSRLIKRPVAVTVVFSSGIVIFLVGLILSIADSELGIRVSGVAMLAVAGWLLVFDIARRTVRESGLTRFIAAGLLSGYAWLAVSGATWLAFGARPFGLQYDAMLHAFFLGFVFSMIFAHAPIIFPSILGVSISYSSSFYGHLALLHTSLVVRVVGGLLGWSPGFQWGGLVTGVAVVLFLVNTMGHASIWSGKAPKET